MKTGERIPRRCLLRQWQFGKGRLTVSCTFTRCFHFLFSSFIWFLQNFYVRRKFIDKHDEKSLINGIGIDFRRSHFVFEQYLLLFRCPFPPQQWTARRWYKINIIRFRNFVNLVKKEIWKFVSGENWGKAIGWRCESVERKSGVDL